MSGEEQQGQVAANFNVGLALIALALLWSFGGGREHADATMKWLGPPSATRRRRAPQRRARRRSNR